MKISAVQNSDFTPNYKGKFFKEGSFIELEKSLTGTEKDTFEHIVTSIEDAKDDNQWWFNIKKIHNGSRQVATMGLVKKDGTPRKPGLFLVEAEKSMEIFKNLHKWYKNNVESYKG